MRRPPLIPSDLILNPVFLIWIPAFAGMTVPAFEARPPHKGRWTLTISWGEGMGDERTLGDPAAVFRFFRAAAFCGRRENERRGGRVGPKAPIAEGGPLGLAEGRTAGSLFLPTSIIPRIDREVTGSPGGRGPPCRRVERTQKIGWGEGVCRPEPVRERERAWFGKTEFFRELESEVRADFPRWGKSAW